MPLKGIIQKKVETFFKEYQDQQDLSEGEKFQLFSIYHIIKGYEIDFEDVLTGIVDEGDDFGIDAIYVFIDRHLVNDIEDLNQFFNNESKVTIRVVQVKKETGFKEEALLKLRDGIENIFDIDKPLKGNQELKQKGLLIREVWTKWHDSGNKKDFDVIIDYVTLGKLNEINHKVVDKKNKILSFLNYIGLKTAEFNFVDQKILFDISSIQKYSKVLEAINSIEYDMEHNKDVYGYLLIVDGRKFYDFLVSDGDMIEDKALFFQNFSLPLQCCAYLNNSKN